MDTLSQKLTALFGRYKYVLLVLGVGLLLLLWPSGEGTGGAASATNATAGETFDLPALEARLEGALSCVQGVGRVRVVLTLKTDMEVLLSKDGRESRRREMEGGVLQSENYEADTETVMQNSAAGSVPVVVGRVYPVFLGALVVCEGAASKTVQLRVVEAVSALTGLGSDKITVAVMTPKSP